MRFMNFVEKLRDQFSYDDEFIDDEPEVEEEGREADAYSFLEDEYAEEEAESRKQHEFMHAAQLHETVRAEQQKTHEYSSSALDEMRDSQYDFGDDDEDELRYDEEDYAPFSGQTDRNGRVAAAERPSGNLRSGISLKKASSGNEEIMSRCDTMFTEATEEGKKMNYEEKAPQMVYDLNRDIQYANQALALLEIRLLNFDDVKEICGALKSGNGIVCYMDDVEAQIANQFICYLNGFCSALNAQMNKIAEATFILTPRQVRFIKEEERERYRRNNTEDIRRRSAM